MYACVCVLYKFILKGFSSPEWTYRQIDIETNVDLIFEHQGMRRDGN